MRRLGRFAATTACLAVLLAGAGAPSGNAAPAPPTPAAQAGRVPVFAYFYQWFERSSWLRAKMDHPLAGNYSSDDPHVLRDQIQQARAAGVDGFLTSWKDTPALDRRLRLLLAVAASEHFEVGVVYEALDFYRKPLPVATVRADMLRLTSEWGPELRTKSFGRPVIIWTGTDQYSTADVRSVHEALGRRAYLLAASKTVDGYERVAADVDGEAYYWSSANPRSATTATKLDQLSAAVHRHGGRWIAPAAAGFDGRTLGHTRVIARDGGSTFRLSLDHAYASTPDAVGVISWNEWSENTYIEPGRRYGTQELSVLRDYLRSVGHGVAGRPDRRVPVAHGGPWSGFNAAVVLAVTCLVGLVLLLTTPRRRTPVGNHAQSRKLRALTSSRS
jgi:hypothetical protein